MCCGKSSRTCTEQGEAVKTMVNSFMQGEKYCVLKDQTLFQVREKAGGVLRLSGGLLASSAGNSDVVLVSF